MQRNDWEIAPHESCVTHEQTDKTRFALAKFIMSFSKQKDLWEAGNLSVIEKKVLNKEIFSHLNTSDIWKKIEKFTYQIDNLKLEQKRKVAFFYCELRHNHGWTPTASDPGILLGISILSKSTKRRRYFTLLRRRQSSGCIRNRTIIQGQEYARILSKVHLIPKPKILEATLYLLVPGNSGPWLQWRGCS